MKAVVVGSGAWGTALAIRLCKNGHDVTMWTFEKDLIPQMVANRHNPRLPSVVLPEELHWATGDCDGHSPSGGSIRFRRSTWSHRDRFYTDGWPGLCPRHRCPLQQLSLFLSFL